MERTLRWHEKRQILHQSFTADYVVTQATSELEQKSQPIYLFKIKIISFLSNLAINNDGNNNGWYEKITASCYKNPVGIAWISSNYNSSVLDTLKCGPV